MHTKSWSRSMFWLVLLALILVGCRSSVSPTTEAAPEQTLRVFAATPLVDAFTALGSQFEQRYPGTRVILTVGDSAHLTEQLIAGAPADVAALTSARSMHRLMEYRRVGLGADHIFAHNRLVVALPTSNPAHITTLTDLAQPGVRLAIPTNDIPAGTSALELLDRTAAQVAAAPDYTDHVLANVTSFEPGVRAVLAKVALGDADAGIVYASDVATADTAQVAHLDIPEAVNVIASYPIAVIEPGHRTATAQQFVAFVLSPAGQHTLAEHGFVPAR